MASVRVIPAVTDSRPDRRARSNKKRAAPHERARETKPVLKDASGRAKRPPTRPKLPKPEPLEVESPAPPPETKALETKALARPARTQPVPVRTYEDPSLDFTGPGLAEAILQALAAYEALRRDDPERTPVGVA